MYRRIAITLKGLSWSILVCILSSCTLPSNTATLATGRSGGFFATLGQQVIKSTSDVVNMQLQNVSSEGSKQNLDLLRQKKVDFALVQLDVANEAMKKGQIQAVLSLTDEVIHVIVRTDSELKTFTDLKGKRVFVGKPGTGTNFTIKQLLSATELKVQEDNTGLEEAFEKLKANQLDAVIFVGGLGGDPVVREQLEGSSTLRLLPIQSTVINYLTLGYPDSYQAANIPTGLYSFSPSVPPSDVPTLSTSTVLATHPDVDPQKIRLVVWSILTTSRQYSLFNPALNTDDPKAELQSGLVYVNSNVQEVFEQGDPRAGWMRAIEENALLKTTLYAIGAISALGGTAGVVVGRLQKESSKRAIKETRRELNELSELLLDNPQRALEKIQQLHQQHRRLYVDGKIDSETYNDIEEKTGLLEVESRDLLEKQREEFVRDTLTLLDQLQNNSSSSSEIALKNLREAQKRHQEMVLQGEMDIQTYMQLRELMLILSRDSQAEVYSNQRFR